MRTRTARRSLLALAGVTAGITSLTATGVPAAAAPTDGPWVSPEEAAKYQEPSADALQALTTCTDFRDFLPNSAVAVWVPTTADGNGNCMMGVGSQGNGVGKLQLAIHDCYPDLRGVMGPIDKIYGGGTRAAVAEVQRRSGVPDDGAYGPQTKNAMRWPGYLNGQLLQPCRTLV